MLSVCEGGTCTICNRSLFYRSLNNRVDFLGKTTSISKSGLRIENRLTAVCHSSSSTDTRSVAEAARRPVAWSGRASLTGMRARRRFPTSRAIMASNPVLSTTTKRRFRQRIVLPGVKVTETAITVLGMRGLKNQTIPARLPPILQ
jgi:hypothetical protein